MNEWKGSGRSSEVRFPVLRALVLATILPLLGCSGGEDSAELQRKLEEGSAAERLAALEAISRTSPKALELPRLRLLLEDPSPAVRALALSIAARRGEPQIIDWIGPGVLDPEPEVRRAALDALLDFEDSERERYLIAAYPLQDLSGRRAIVEELEDRDEKLLELIGEEARTIWERNLAALRDGGVAELVGVLDMVGRSGRPEAIERLAALLESESTQVAVAAARGLSLGGGGEVAREALVQLLDSEIPARREAAAEALRRLGFDARGQEGEAEEGPEIDSLWVKAEDVGAALEERLAALRELGVRGGQGRRLVAFALRQLEELEAIRSEDGEASSDREEASGLLVAIAAEGPHALADEKLRQSLKRYVEDPIPQLRALALRAGGLDAAEALRAKASEDPSWEVRTAAVEALARKEGGEITTALASLAGIPGVAAERALAELERRGEADALLRVFQRTASAQAAAALGRLGRREAATPLLDPQTAAEVTPAWLLSLRKVEGRAAAAAARLHLAHDRPEIRAAAAEVLSERCDWEAMPLLRALAAQDYFVEVRKAAEDAVRAIRLCPPG